MDSITENWKHYVKQNKVYSEKQTLHDFSHL